ncbi:hypothetical protein [Telluria beijingensis]|uniref:hypothetical protein n=1 Tax=Telluria beijingensis TaxID=3068633 RepID=UPI002795B9EA|nr:hypothetical protein [Massilia sp. REN29]
MSQIDPTGVENAGEEALLEDRGQMSYEEISGLTNGELGLHEPHDTAPTGALPEAPPIPHVPPAPIPKFPIPPIPLPIKKAVSGCYAGTLGAFQVDLRVDVDRSRPMKRVSGDFYQTVGKTTSYFGSFVVDSPTITVSSSKVVVKGMGRFTFAAGAPVVQVTIPRVNILQPQAAATLQFFTVTNAPGASYHCPFSSLHFRTVRIETDSVSDLVGSTFASYDTGSLPSGGSARNLSVVSAFGEAGIGMVPTGGNNVINISEAQANAAWSNAELHASMQTHFTLWSDVQQWCVWQLVAQQHDYGSGLYGIMFDQQGKQRQGCAVFNAGIGGASAEQQRLQLYTYVHELGHCFNLLHSWQKSLASPPKPDRPDALSWMNYPWYYPKGGPAGFWSSFDFRFDDEELIHLRHGFRNDVIMGGNNFIVGSSLGREVLADPIADESGLVLGISTHQRSFALGEPVVLELKLKATTTRGRRAHTWLHPDFGMVRIVISKPSGQVVAYEPMIDHLVGERQQVLGVDDEVRDSAYIGYGKGGFYFDQPGQYRVRAAYAALDGSQVLSDILTIRVRYPVTRDEDTLADLFMGDDQGVLLYLQGSDNVTLRSGNAAFDEVIDRFGAHPMATYARMIKGINAGRVFKTVNAGKGRPVTVRAANKEESIALLASVAGTHVLDPVSEDEVRYTLSCVQMASGDERAAQDTLNQITTQVFGRPEKE